MTNIYRFYQLDALRGVCAIIVVASHFLSFFGLNLIKYSGCAVDFFFILSGFIIVHSYGEKIISGMTFSQFLKLRYLRLAPLNTVASIIGLIASFFIILNLSKADQVLLQEIPYVFLNSIFFLPYFSNLSWPYGNGLELSGVFPLNLPAWSLFFEIFISIFCFLYIKLLKKIPGFFVGSISYLILIFSVFIYHDPNAGWSSDNFILGFPRVLGCFFAGACIYKIRTKYFLLNFNATVKFLSLLLIFIFFIFSNETMAFINSLIIMPITVLIFSYEPKNLNYKSIYYFLGFISYPLYVLHIPLFSFIFRFFGFVFNYGTFFSLMILGFIVILCSIVMGYLDLRFRKLFN